MPYWLAITQEKSDMTNDLGKNIKSAGPAMPVEIIGLTGLPSAGDRAKVMKNDKVAKQASETLLLEARQKKLISPAITSKTYLLKTVKIKNNSISY